MPSLPEPVRARVLLVAQMRHLRRSQQMMPGLLIAAEAPRQRQQMSATTMLQEQPQAALLVAALSLLAWSKAAGRCLSWPPAPDQMILKQGAERARQQVAQRSRPYARLAQLGALVPEQDWAWPAAKVPKAAKMEQQDLRGGSVARAGAALRAVRRVPKGQPGVTGWPRGAWPQRLVPVMALGLALDLTDGQTGPVERCLAWPVPEPLFDPHGLDDDAFHGSACHGRAFQTLMRWWGQVAHQQVSGQIRQYAAHGD